LLRFLSLGSYDLYDKTEARYAGIAMRMANNNDFITPYIEPSMPFLAKPPLSFWVTAISFKIFGINEFAARLPHFLFGMLLVTIIYLIFRKFYGPQQALTLSTILLSIPSFIVMSGMVMTESILIFCISLAMLSAWVRLEKNGTVLYSHLFFISLGFAMLAKGPIGLVMVCIPLAMHLTIYKKWSLFFNKFNIFTGSLLAALIFMPWYILEEIKNPGFLQYFLLGEHFGRFLIPGWKGDLYGHAHNEPIGMMLLYFIISTIPWVIYPIISFVRRPSSLFKSKPSKDIVFFSCFAFFPVIFFLPARNIILSYGMFCIVPFAILIFYYFRKNGIKTLPFTITAAICPILMICILIANYFDIIPASSDKKFVQFTKMNKQSTVLYFNTNIEYSSLFYSFDQLKLVSHENELEQLPNNTLIVTTSNAFNTIENNRLKNKLHCVMCNKNSDRCLYKYQKEID
jgi:4-amino-4-deoxy-L-arabinose transferase-like glycosyltransferase